MLSNSPGNQAVLNGNFMDVKWRCHVRADSSSQKPSQFILLLPVISVRAQATQTGSIALAALSLAF